MTDRRYPFANLAAAMCMTEAQAARELGLSGSTEKDYRTRGVTPRVADRLAVKAGLHPAEVWPSFVDDALEDQRKAYNARKREAERRRYWADPERRERVKARARAYHDECRDYQNAARRRRYWADPESERAKRRVRSKRSGEAA